MSTLYIEERREGNEREREREGKGEMKGRREKSGEEDKERREEERRGEKRKERREKEKLFNFKKCSFENFLPYMYIMNMIITNTSSVSVRRSWP